MADYKKIQDKWQKKWEENKVFEVKEDPTKKKFYCLSMFPYPSGSGLHMGHALNYTIGDVYARFKRLQGYNTIYPLGFDSLGLPAENAAIKTGKNPKEFTEKAIKNFIKQMKELGLSNDWSRKIETHKPEYYKWDQWIFAQMFKKGIAYQKKSNVNWCPECKTVLANEQVQNGKCWRHEKTSVKIVPLKQWFLKTTVYAEELNKDIDTLTGWSDDIKTMQKNWIGKSHGTEVQFEINGKEWTIFTTRPDTIYGVTFMVIAAQHQRLMELVTDEQKEKVEEFLKNIKTVSEKQMEDMEKEGVFTGSYAINPLTRDKIPVYAGNFVVADYGSGMVMAVPAHDQRDFEFAKKYGISIKKVIEPDKKRKDKYDSDVAKWERAYVEHGKLVNSDKFDGMDNKKAIEEITKELSSKEKGGKKVQYKLRDWLISRQRYWGTPIPIIHCEKCGSLPVAEKDLPVILPDKVKFGEGNPLETNENFVNVKCPHCDSPAKRETDTMDTFVNSSWYFMRYCDPHNNKNIFDKSKTKYWLPIDQYIGGREHACMHLIYFRFYTKFLRDIGLLEIDEPTYNLFNQGILRGPDGEKMSKSKGNVVLPETVSEKYGIDTARLFLLSVAAPDKDIDWSDTGIEGSFRFMNKVMKYFDSVKIGKTSEKLTSKLHKAIRDVEEYIQNFKYNLAIIKIRELFDNFELEESKETLEAFVKLLHPFCPHVTEELWEQLGNEPFISLSDWPKFDESKIDEKAEYAEKFAEQTRDDIIAIMKLAGIQKPKQITLIVSAEWKYELFSLLKNALKETRNSKEIIGKVMGTELKRHGKDIMKIIPTVIKDPSKIPEHLLTQKEETESLKEAQKEYQKEFDAKIKITTAEDSTHAKAKNATPGKVAIIVE